LLELRSRRSAPLRLLLRLAHRAFFALTASVVWLSHRSMLQACGHGAGRFVRLCMLQYGFYLEPPRAALAPTARH
jgi:hypothetical protein